MKKRTKIIFLCLIILMLSSIILVGITYSVYLQNKKIINHLQAGELNISLQRIKLEYKSLNEKGYLEDNIDETIVDFTKGNKENIFGSKFIIVPGSKYSSTMLLSSLNSTVAFNYYIEIKTKEDLPSLASQIIITYIEDNKEIKFNMNENNNFGSIDNPLGIVEVGNNKTFIMQIEFIDQDNNNLSMKNIFDFDIIVHAIQKINN